MELPFLPSGDLSDPEIKPISPVLQVDSYPLGHQGSPRPKNHKAKIEMGETYETFQNLSSLSFFSLSSQAFPLMTVCFSYSKQLVFP